MMKNISKLQPNLKMSSWAFTAWRFSLSLLILFHNAHQSWSRQFTFGFTTLTSHNNPSIYCNLLGSVFKLWWDFQVIMGHFRECVFLLVALCCASERQAMLLWADWLLKQVLRCDWAAGDTVCRLALSWDRPVYSAATFPAAVTLHSFHSRLFCCWVLSPTVRLTDCLIDWFL